jgi:hypothetical protein
MDITRNRRTSEGFVSDGTAEEHVDRKNNRGLDADELAATPQNCSSGCIRSPLTLFVNHVCSSTFTPDSVRILQVSLQLQIMVRTIRGDLLVTEH